MRRKLRPPRQAGDVVALTARCAELIAQRDAARAERDHLAAERDALVTRRDELLSLVASISQSTPLDSEVSEALNQRGVMLAEIGTLRSEVSRLASHLRGLEDTYAHVVAVSVDRGVRADRLAAALVEACDLFAYWHETRARGVGDALSRIATLRAVAERGGEG